jgi:hypothetical protein
MNKGQDYGIGLWLIFVALGIVLWLLWMFIGSNWRTGDGVSTDYVMGVETSGIFWKTTDVYLRNEHPSSTNVGKYCLPQGLVVTEIHGRLVQAAENNTICKLYYHSTLAQWPWVCDTSGAIIDKVECTKVTK